MSFQVGTGSLGGNVFFQVGLCTPLWTMGVKGKKWHKMTKQICLTLYLINCTSYDCGFWYRCVKCHRVYFEIFLRDGAQYVDKVCIGQFSPEILFQHSCAISAQFGPKSYNLMSQVIMPHDSLSKNFEIWYDGVQ